MLRQRLLLVDDEPLFLNSLQRLLRKEPYELIMADSGESALELCRSDSFDLILTDLRMPGIDGLELLQKLRRENIDTPVIVMTGFGSIQSAVESMKAGAVDYITKPFDSDEIIHVVRAVMDSAANLMSSEDLSKEIKKFGMIGKSKAMREAFKLIEIAASTESNVLIQGETGTGKELVARSIHKLSQRSAMPFIAVNCSAISSGVFESELFGHVKGAFTGALSDKIGILKSADGGTLFLDEIGDMLLELQSKLLRVLQEREMMPVGATKNVSIDIRLLIATNQDLEKAVAQGRFRKDLFFRLHVLPINLSPLRERKEDIIPLALHFLRDIIPYCKSITGFSEEALKALVNYHWPGNVRELKNAVEHAIAVAKKDVIRLDCLPKNIFQAAFKDKLLSESQKDTLLSQTERAKIAEVLGQTGWNKREAAKLLGISRATLYRKISQFNLQR